MSNQKGQRKQKTPLCKGGSQNSLFFGWGIVYVEYGQPLRHFLVPRKCTSPYTGEAVFLIFAHPAAMGNAHSFPFGQAFFYVDDALVAAAAERDFQAAFAEYKASVNQYVDAL